MSPETQVGGERGVTGLGGGADRGVPGPGRLARLAGGGQRLGQRGQHPRIAAAGDVVHAGGDLERGRRIAE